TARRARRGAQVSRGKRAVLRHHLEHRGRARRARRQPRRRRAAVDGNPERGLLVERRRGAVARRADRRAWRVRVERGARPARAARSWCDRRSGAGASPMTWKPTLKQDVDLKSLPLSPTQGYVASRLDGVADVHALAQLTGLSDERVETVLRELVGLGAI